MIRRLLLWTSLLLVLLPLAGCGGAGGQWVAYEPAAGGYRPVTLSAPPAIPLSQVVTADLDADGTLEVVRVENGQVRIEDGGEPAWQGNRQWRVVDIVAGDVEDDLRQEVLIAMWKEDDQGIPRSHPFIIGHRHGRYDVLWGGSAVVDPIRDLDLGDVDGDGRTELVVLEGTYEEPEDAPARFVTVWRWNGWGFTLLWRSEAGQFRHLNLLDVDVDGAVEIVVEDVSTDH